MSRIARIVHSEAFLRSRAAARQISRDPKAMWALVAKVAEADFGAEDLALGEPGVGAAVAMVLARADELDAEMPPAEEDSAVEEARQRLVIAALHYLAMEHDVVPDNLPGGLRDDAAVLRWIFAAAETELAPYVDE